MRRSLLLGTLALGAVVLCGRTYAQGPGYGIAGSGGEYIVNSQVISDTVIGTSESSSGTSTTSGIQRASGGGLHSQAPVSPIMTPTGAGVIGRQHSRPDLFYNYYTQGYSNQVNAQMYLAPVPVPPFVGNTFYTYQPLMPHEYLYTHHDRYHHHYDYGRGLNRTKIGYRPSAPQVVRDMYFNFRIPR